MSHDLRDVGVCTVGRRVPTAMTTISFLRALVGAVVVTGRVDHLAYFGFFREIL